MPSFYTPDAPLTRHRRRLPHWQQTGVWCFVTFRLGDSLPLSVIRKWRRRHEIWMQTHPKPWNHEEERAYHQQTTLILEQGLDRGAGECLLKHSNLSALLSQELLRHQGIRYQINSFVIMPNHVHVLFYPIGRHTIQHLLKNWKGSSSRYINQQLGKQGSIWQPEYWDRLIRDAAHFQRCRRYIENNPAKAGLKEGFRFWQTERGL